MNGDTWALRFVAAALFSGLLPAGAIETVMAGEKTVSGTASARIAIPISSSVVAHLRFGNVKSGSEERCKGVTRMALLYSGPGDPSHVVVGPDAFATVSGNIISVFPTGEKLKSNTTIDVDGDAVTIHTSCSQPIEVGMLFGNYEIVELDVIQDDKPGKGDGTVVVTVDNQIYATGGAKVSGKPPGKYFHRGEVAVAGEKSAPYRIVFPASVLCQREKSKPGKYPPLEARDFVTYSTTVGGVTSSSGVLSRDGKDTFYVGGTLIVPAKAKGGTYSCILPVTVTY